MGFLKVITSIAIAILFLIFLNNLMAMIFPVSNGGSSYYSGSSDAYKKCESLQPDYSKNIDSNSPEIKTAQGEYQACTDKAQRELNDKTAIESQYIWLRAIIVLLILVGVSIFMFKKFPFYGGSLIGAGLLFVITYPIFAKTGFSFDMFSGGGDISASVKTQTQLMKMLISFVGATGLSVADVMFFEKHKENNVLTQNNNLPPEPQIVQQNTPIPPVYPNPTTTQMPPAPEDTADINQPK